MSFSFARGRASRKVCIGGLAEAPAALVGALLIVDEHPFIKVGLQDVRRVVELLSERDPVELIQQRLVEALANTVGLRALHLGAGVVDVLDSEIQLIFVSYSWRS